MGFNFDSFHKGLMCHKDGFSRIYWPAAPSASALQNKTKLKQSRGPFFKYPSIISIDRKGLLQQMDRKVNHYGAHLECRWMGNELQCYNRPMRVKLLYHAKESIWETPGGITLHSAFSWLKKKKKYSYYLVKLTIVFLFYAYIFLGHFLTANIMAA